MLEFGYMNSYNLFSNFYLIHHHYSLVYIQHDEHGLFVNVLFWIFDNFPEYVLRTAIFYKETTHPSPSDKISSPTLARNHPNSLSKMSTSNGRRLRLNTVTVNLGCSRPRLSNIFHPKPKPKSKTPTNTYHSNSYYPYQYSTTTATSLPCDSDIKSLRAVQGFGRIGGESVAVEKDSDDPYLDFRRSMRQMILENEIYSKDDLRELLNCFLQLNSPDCHGVIVRAFTEIWNGVFSVPRLQGGRRSRAF